MSVPYPDTQPQLSGGEVNRPDAVEIAAKAIEEWAEQLRGEDEPNREAAFVAVHALAAAGLLLPEGAETRTEWGWDCGHPRAPEQSCVHAGPEDWARSTATHVWPDGALVSRWTAETPWLAVGDSKPTGQDPSVSVEETPYRNVINPGGGPIDIPDVGAYIAMFDEDEEPYVDLGGDMIVPLRELIESDGEVSGV